MPKPMTDVSLPRSYGAVDDFLNAFQHPTEPFDPDGDWEHRYAVWIVVPKQGVGRSHRAGSLHLRRQPAEAGAIRLSVALAAQQGGNTTYQVSARLVAAADALTTPRSWELDAQILGAQRQPVADTQVSETGEVANGVIRLRGTRQRLIPEPEAWTSNWSLFDAVQRRPIDRAEPLAFTMLEELSLPKPDQRLAYREATELELGGRLVRLHCFEQTGVGILPYQYWLDDQHRLLVAVGGLRAFVFDATAAAPGEQP